MDQSREAMPGAYDDRQSSSIFDNPNTFSDELDSILMSNWVDGATESMMIEWPFDDPKIVPDSSLLGDEVVTGTTQCFSAGCDPFLQASQDGGMASAGTKGVDFPHSDRIAPLSDMFTSCLELDQSFIDLELFKLSPLWIPNYTVPISPESMYQLPPTSAPFPSRLLNDKMYENDILQIFSCEPPQDLPVPAQKQTDSLMIEEACKDTLQSQRPAQSIETDNNGVAGLGHPSAIISDQQQGAADIVQPTRGTPVVNGSSVKDGYNWRKYGQKNVKDSNFPRSYYKCTYPRCQMTKKEERSLQGNLTEIIYKGVHNHPEPNPSSRASSYPENDAPHFSSKMSNDDVVQGDETDSKRQKMEFNAAEIMRSSSRSARQVKYLVLAYADFDIINDGYRWRKYGSKVVKGNSNPRSYYRCTDSGCKARKLVERSPDDFKKLMTTYEGTHNHGVPGPKNSTSSSSSNCTANSAIGSSVSLVPRFGCPNIVSLPRSLPNLPAAANALETVAAAPLPTRMRTPILPQISSYSGFRGPFQPGMMTMMMPKLESIIQPPLSKTKLALQPNGDGTAISRLVN